MIPIETWRSLELAARPKLKELLLAASPRGEVPVPPRRAWHRRKPSTLRAWLEQFGCLSRRNDLRHED